MLEGLMRFLGVTPKESKMYIEGQDDVYYIMSEGGQVFAGPYKREKDAKGQLTRLRKSYTPASRRPNKEA